MSRLNFQNKMEGHRVEAPFNRDLEQKLTYQQLLNLNHDLSKENLQLKNIGNRLGQELKNLHSQFDIKPREENAQLYNAIGNHPMLHQYQLTLIPLLDAYQAKIQQFENGFQTINEEFINLEKKYEEVAAENQKLRAERTDNIKELFQVYRNGSSEKLGADFGQIILQQINQKQKFLVEENARLQRDSQRFKSEAQKYGRELALSRTKEQDATNKLKQLEMNQKQLQTKLKTLEQAIFNSQLKNNQLESQKRKIQSNLQRAQSQVSQLNKDKDDIAKNYQNFKVRYEKEVTVYQDSSDRWGNTDYKQKNVLQETKQQPFNNDDSHKKLAKLQKEYQRTVKERNQFKELLEVERVNLTTSNDRLAELKKKFDALDLEKRVVEASQVKNKKLLEQMIDKSKNDLQKIRKQHQQEMQRAEDDYYSKIEAKQRKINQIQESLDKANLERDKLAQQNIIHTTLNKDNKGNKNKDSDRAVEKLKDKLAINEELFKEQLQILQNDNVYLKRETDNFKNQNKEKAEELRKLRQELQKIKKELIQVTEQKTILIQEIKRVRNQYQGNLKDKEKLFDQKIREIKMVVEESDRRRKGEKEKVAEASRQYKRVLEQIKSTYEERIKVLEGENYAYNSKAKKSDNFC